MDVGSPKEIIEQKIHDCDYYLGIFDRRWGYVPPDNNPEKLSVTAIEYQRAKIRFNMYDPISYCQTYC